MSFRSDELDSFIARLDLKATVLENCDTTNDYREAQEYRKLIEDVKRLEYVPERISGIGIIKAIRDQRDELAGAFRPLVALLKEEQWNLRARQYAHAYALAAAALDKVPTYAQQLQNVCDGLGITREQLDAALKRHACENGT